MISPGLRIGRYEVGRRLGKGGFGVVHVARDLELDRDIAIKVLRSEYAARPQIVQRFIKEARSAAKIGHAGIVTVFECSQIQHTGTHADGNAYIAMELLVGESLSDRLLNGGRMAIAEALAITRQLAAALAAAHAAGIVHRDLKPDNVFLVPDAAVHGGERVKVLDFGVAKLLDAEDGVNTNSQMMLGTPKYMAPEQARSAAKVDHRGDIYTLGCMLFEMLTGRAPFSGDAGDQIIAHQQAPIPSPREHTATVPPALDALARRMLAKSPDDRPQTMHDIVDALADLGDEPDTMVRTPIVPHRTSAEITTVAEPMVRFRDPRFRAAMGLGAVVAAMLVVVLVMRRGAAPVVAPPAPVVIALDAAAAVVADIDAGIDVGRVRLACLSARDAKAWLDLVACAERLRELDPARGDELYQTAQAELEAEAGLRTLERALATNDLAAARAALDAIPVESVYRQEAARAYQLATRPAAAATARVASPTCAVETLNDEGTTAMASQDFARALRLFEQAYRCKPSGDLLRKVFLMTCKLKNVTRARALYRNADASTRSWMAGACANNGVRQELLGAR